ncbi:MAG: DUF393 domain-containing protein [Bryobacteraceae bacterium]|nr:DUF393 domain-containing protein [Bryobacteraceae bacterium]
MIVVYDGDCGLCERSRRVVESLDWLGAFTWIKSQDPAAAPLHVDPSRVWAIDGPRRWSGYAAWRQILLRLPAFYVLSAALALLPLLALLPVFDPLGERLYTWVAHNRHRLPGPTCSIPEK